MVFGYLDLVMLSKFRRCSELQKMTDLSRERMEATPPFMYCRMDFFGPLYIKEGRRMLKCYGLLFTCLCSRALHKELLEDMTTDTFIPALHAFIALCGMLDNCNPIRALALAVQD